MISRIFKKRTCLFIIISLLLFAGFSFAQPQEPPKQESKEAEEPSPEYTIKKYRNVLAGEIWPYEAAEAHYRIGYALERLGRETEATAEYLKVIVNYPEETEFNKKAEERLSRLYSGFRDKSRELVGRYVPSGGQKDPTIFFAYIKSLYENYRNLGEYDRAIHILQKLYDMDPENSTYLINMGDIYLHGYNDPEKAIFHYRKALEAAPNNPRAYAGLGRAYEKKGDYEGAINLYARAAEISPVSPWAIYGLRRIDGIRLAGDKRLVKDWYFIGPFDNSDKEGLKKVFPPEEKTNLKATYKGKNGVSVKWFRPFGYDSSGYVDLNTVFKPNDYAVAYALTYAYSPTKRKIQIRVGAEDGIRIGINGKEVMNYENARSQDVDGDLIAVALNKGWNKILVKVSDTWGAWGFYFRVTDMSGNPVEDLIFDPLKDDKRQKRIYKRLLKEKRFRLTKIAAMYVIAASALLFGLYFMISNIYHRIKINRMKEDFVSSVSHELKTPIAAVKMLTETLKRGRIKEPKRIDEYYGMIIRESTRLTRFINKILDFSRIEKGGKIFYFEKENVVDTAKTAVEIYKDEAQDKSLKIHFNADKKELTAEMDKDAILQVIINLMDNAYKYSRDEKDITVSVKDAGKEIHIEVEDKGLGIPKKNIEKIFEKFYRVERDMMGEIKGSGLGLSFVKSVISAHNGRIAVESEIGVRSKFIISLPRERA